MKKNKRNWLINSEIQLWEGEKDIYSLSAFCFRKRFVGLYTPDKTRLALSQQHHISNIMP